MGGIEPTGGGGGPNWDSSTKKTQSSGKTKEGQTASLRPAGEQPDALTLGTETDIGTPVEQLLQLEHLHADYSADGLQKFARIPAYSFEYLRTELAGEPGLLARLDVLHQTWLNRQQVLRTLLDAQSPLERVLEAQAEGLAVPVSPAIPNPIVTPPMANESHVAGASDTSGQGDLGQQHKFGQGHTGQDRSKREKPEEEQ